MSGDIVIIGGGLAGLTRPERSRSPWADVGGEIDEALAMFWYRDLLRPGTDSPEVDPDWGIHVNRVLVIIVFSRRLGEPKNK